MSTERLKRRLSAILSADVEGYSRLMRQDEEATVLAITGHRAAMTRLIDQYRGRVVDSPGDNLLAEFSSVVDAVNCAVEIQLELTKRNAGLPEDRRMLFRIGIHMGDVLEEGERIYGDGVNVAARMEQLAESGKICLSGTAYDAVENRIGLGYEFLGEHKVKNIDKPIRAYKVLPFSGASTNGMVRDKRKTAKTWRNAIVIGSALLVVGAAAAAWHFYFGPLQIRPASLEKMAYPLPEKPSIAVLPFDNMSNDPDQEYFSDGLTEEIITALSKTPKLFVIARNSAFVYKKEPVKAQKVAEELGVRYILEGSVRKSADRVRITAQLIDALKGYHLWAERYDRDLKDIFALQDEITKKVVTALQVELSEGEQARLSARGTDNLDAYLKVLEGREYLFRFNREDNLKARQKAEEALALDPGYSDAYSLLGKTHILDVWFHWSESPKESMGKSFELAKKALALKKYNFEGHRILSHIYLLNRKYEEAIAESERAVSLAPGTADSLYNLGIVLRFSGRAEEAISMFEKAIRLNPMPPASYFYQLGLSYAFAGEFEKAVAVCRKGLPLNPNDLVGRVTLTMAYSSLGREVDARREAAEVLRIDPNFTLEYAAKTWPYKDTKDRDFIFNALRKAGLPKTPPLPLPEKPSIAVLPFENMSSEPEQEYFSDGLTEDIITALSKIPKLFVIARNSSFMYKGKSVWIPTVGKELGVRYVLEGSVRKAGGKVRVTAQLIDALSNSHVWAERYDRGLRDIFAIQDEITKKILTALQIQMTEGEQALVYARGTSNLEAYLKLLEAFEYGRRQNPKDNETAKRVLKEVVELDPNYAAAYRLLGAVHMMDVWMGSTKSPRDSLKTAAELCRRATSLDASLGSAYALLGHVHILMRDYEKGIEEGQKAVDLEPNGADSHAYLGLGLTYAGQPEQAIKMFDKAIRLNPMAPSWYLHSLAGAYRNMGRYGEAVEWGKKAVERSPDNALAHLVLASCYSLAGLEKDAKAEAREVLSINPHFSLERFSKTTPLQNPDVKNRLIDALRKAGLR